MSNEMETQEYMRQWMTLLQKEIREHIPLIHLAIPGASHIVSFEDEEVCEDVEESSLVMDLLSQFFPDEFQFWSAEKSRDVNAQLLRGIRYFSFFLSKPKIGILESADEDTLMEEARQENIVEQHQPHIEHAISVIKKFLAKNSKEFIILDFQNFHNMLYCNHLSLQDFIMKAFGEMAFTRSDGKLKNLTLASMHEKGKQVLIIYRLDHVQQYFWPGRFWPIHAPKTSTCYANLDEFLDDAVLHRDLSVGQISKYVVPSPVQNWFMDLWLTFAAKLNGVGKQAESWVNINHRKLAKAKHYSKINVLEIANEEIDKFQLIVSIVSINWKLEPLDSAERRTSQESSKHNTNASANGKEKHSVEEARKSSSASKATNRKASDSSKKTVRSTKSIQRESINSTRKQSIKQSEGLKSLPFPKGTGKN